MDEGAIMQGLALPARFQRSKIVVPAVGPFDDPTPGPSANAADQRLFTAPADVWHDAAFSGFVLGVVVVVALVEAQVHRPARPARPLHEDGIEGRADHPLVVDVRAGQGDGQWDSATVGQNVALGAELRAIGRIGASELPPFGALTMALSSEAQSQSIPLS